MSMAALEGSPTGFGAALRSSRWIAIVVIASLLGLGCGERRSDRNETRDDGEQPRGWKDEPAPQNTAPTPGSSSASAEHPPAAPLTADGANMPDLSGDEYIAAPGPEHEQLWFFLGDWEGTEEYPPSPYVRDGGTGKGTFSFRAMHEIWLDMDYNTVVTSKAGKVYEYGYRGVFYFHRFLKTYQQWLFHHLGEGEYSEGYWKDDHFFFESDDPMIGLPHGSRYTYKVLSDDEFQLRVEETFDKVNWELDMIGTYKRVLDRRASAPKVEKRASDASGEEGPAQPDEAGTAR